MRVFATLLSSALLLTACDGGGSGGPAPTPTPTPTPVVNRPPVFTTPNIVYMPENQTLVGNIVAVDPEGAPVTYTITGGEDRAFFTLTSAGQLSFLSPPDFENPLDSNHNNNYDLEITASDGTNTVRGSFGIIVTDIGPSDYVLSDGGTIGWPYSAIQPGTFTDGVIRSTGQWRDMFPPTRGSLPPSGSFAANISTTDERGLLGFIQTREGPTGVTGGLPGFWYIAMRTAANGDLVLSWNNYENGVSYFAIDRKVIWRIPNTATRNLGGWIEIGPDGFLYVAIGDGETPANAQDPASPYGKLFRIDPNGDSFPADPDRNFTVPAGGMTVALGLRNPVWASFDRTGNLIVGDRGASVREELNVIRPGETNVNFGWPYFEGSLRQMPGGPAAPRMPALELAHGSGPLDANAIVPGSDYRGPSTGLAGQYIFGDTRGTLWMIPLARLLSGTATTADLVRTEELFRPNLPNLLFIGTNSDRSQLGLLVVNGATTRRFYSISKP